MLLNKHLVDVSTLAYVRLAIFILITVFLLLLLYGLWAIISSLKHERYSNRHSFKTYEFGTTTIGNAQRLSHSDFFLLSALFIIFDVELMFMFLWISGLGFSSHLVYRYSFFAFICLLFIGLGYELVNGILTWYRLKG